MDYLKAIASCIMYVVVILGGFYLSFTYGGTIGKYISLALFVGGFMMMMPFTAYIVNKFS